MLLGADLLQCVGANVMIRHDEAILGNNFARAAAVEAHRGSLHMVQPRIGQLKAMTLLQEFSRRIIEEPHPLVRVNFQTDSQKQQAQTQTQQ